MKIKLGNLLKLLLVISILLVILRTFSTGLFKQYALSERVETDDKDKFKEVMIYFQISYNFGQRFIYMK